MPEVRKRPCRICRRWFRPDSRVGVRQRACHAPECQTARRQKTQASWRSRNAGYAIAWVDADFAGQALGVDRGARVPVLIISCSLREALYVLDGLLESNTILRLGEHYTDTHGFTEHVFGLCYLLGYSFIVEASGW